MGKREGRSLNLGRERQRTLFVVVAIFMLIVVIRLFSLQLVRHQEFARFAQANQMQRERVPAPRGFLLDRNGQVLVDNVLHFEINMSWQTRDDVAEAASSLAARLPVDTARVMARFDAWREKNGRAAFPIVPDADKFMISFVRENFDDFPNLRVRSRARRRYRSGPLAAHFLGYVGEATGEDLVRANNGRRYHAGDMVGKTALELFSEDVLRGTDGQRILEVNASGRILGEVKELSIPPVPGRDVVLTIDANLQAYLESLLAPHGPSAAVVMSVDDGAILAAASLPGFDPNEFATGISQASLNALFEEKTKPLFNRLTQARYPPASTIKVVSAYAVITNELVNPERVLVYCDGTYRFGNRVFRCWEQSGHGWMNLTTAVVQSCDSYFYKVAESMDVDVMASAMRTFGFGEKTGIDLPAENRGLVPDREYYDRRFGKGRWTQGLMLNNIIGQGEYLSTVLQVARMSSAVANGGYLVTPHLIERVEGEAPVSYPRRRVAKLSGSTLRFLRNAMESVVEDRDGTAHWTRLGWMRTAGKTGTAQNPHGDHHAWYTAYAPADDPEICVTVMVENAGHGGEVAAPIVRDFFTRYYGRDALSAGDATDSGETADPDAAGGPE